MASWVVTTAPDLSITSGSPRRLRAPQELERQEKRLSTLQSVRPAYMDEYERLQVCMGVCLTRTRVPCQGYTRARPRASAHDCLARQGSAPCLAGSIAVHVRPGCTAALIAVPTANCRVRRRAS